MPKTGAATRGSKSLPDHLADALAKNVEALIKARYPTRRPNQTRLAKEMGLVQPVLSGILAGKGCGILGLLKLRDWSGQPIDTLLGLSPRVDRATILSVVAELMRDAEPPQVPSPPSAASRALLPKPDSGTKK